MLITAQKQKTKQLTMQGQKTDLLSTQKQATVQKQATAQIQATATLQDTLTLQDSLSLQDAISISDTASLQDTSTLQRQKQRTKQDTIQDTKLEVVPEITGRIKLKSDSSSKMSSFLSVQNQPGYNAYVKRKQLKTGKGKYKGRGYTKVNKKPLTEEGAKALAMQILDRYANRSGYIKKAGKPAKERGPRLNPSLENKFRPNKKNPNIFTEKTKHAIDSPDEVKGIPYEAKRQKKIASLLGKPSKKGGSKWL